MSACHTESDAPPPPPGGWPTTLDRFSIVWSAEPGIDLAQAPAVTVRAYTESFYLATLTGDQKYLYPGFEHAVARGSDLWPRSDDPAKKSWVGTAQNRIVAINTKGREVTAKVCVYLYSVAVAEHADEYSALAGPPGEPYPGVYPMHLVLAAPADGENRRELPPQAGPAQAPQDDVFNGWRVTGGQGNYFTATGRPEVDLTLCDTMAPDSPNRRAELTGGYRPRADFPTLPTAPGWPRNVGRPRAEAGGQPGPLHRQVSQSR